MGQWFKKFFENHGHTILISGRKTRLTAQDLAEQSHVIILSMPLEPALDFAAKIGPLLGEEKLLMDLCSMKQAINIQMEKSTRAQVIGTHPLFGPSTRSMKGQNIVLCPMRGVSWLKWLENEFSSAGALTKTDGATHDRNMAVVQGLTHFVTIAFGKTLEQMKIAPKNILPYATPIFRLKLDLLGRMFAQDIELYKDLICSNANAPEVLNAFIKAATKVNNTLCKNDQALELMEQIQKFLGDFPAQGLEESDACLDTLAKIIK